MSYFLKKSRYDVLVIKMLRYRCVNFIITGVVVASCSLDSASSHLGGSGRGRSRSRWRPAYKYWQEYGDSLDTASSHLGGYCRGRSRSRWRTTCKHWQDYGDAWILGYNEYLTFFKENEIHKPHDGCKLKSKTHLRNTFFNFLSRFLRGWLQSLKKVLIWPLKKKIFDQASAQCSVTGSNSFTSYCNESGHICETLRGEDLFGQ